MFYIIYLVGFTSKKYNFLSVKVMAPQLLWAVRPKKGPNLPLNKPNVSRQLIKRPYHTSIEQHDAK